MIISILPNAVVNIQQVYNINTLIINSETRLTDKYKSMVYNVILAQSANITWTFEM